MFLRGLGRLGFLLSLGAMGFFCDPLFYRALNGGFRNALTHSFSDGFFNRLDSLLLGLLLPL
jgi:hypothetical protein